MFYTFGVFDLCEQVAKMAERLQAELLAVPALEQVVRRLSAAAVECVAHVLVLL